MPRRQSTRIQEFSSAESKAKKLLTSPLRSIGEKLLETLYVAERGLESPVEDSRLKHLAEYVVHVADRLPQSFGDRFHFDAALISGIGRDLGKRLEIPGMMVPRHGQDWGYERVMMPSEDANSAHFVYLLLLPKEDLLEDVDLLSYPLIIHEINHYCFAKHESLFVPQFQAELNKVVCNLRLGGISDSGSARARAQEYVDELLGFWTPRTDQSNWAHELAIDIASVWMCGPAYLSCFHDLVEHADPYAISSTHPPCALRAEALIEASQQLGLEKYSSTLDSLLSKWQQSGPGYSNRQRVLTSPDLMQACIKIAFDFCRSLGVPPCSGEYMEQLYARTPEIKTDEIGIDLLIHAWMQFEKHGEAGYASWERKVVAELTKNIMS